MFLLGTENFTRKILLIRILSPLRQRKKHQNKQNQKPKPKTKQKKKTNPEVFRNFRSVISILNKGTPKRNELNDINFYCFKFKEKWILDS